MTGRTPWNAPRAEDVVTFLPSSRWATVKDALRIPFRLLVAASLVGLFVVVTADVVHDDLLVQHLRAHETASTTGVVTGVTERHYRRFGVRYHREVTYLDGLTTTDTSRCRCSAVGDRVAVTYDESQPERAMATDRLEGWTRLAYLPVAMILLLTAVLVGAWTFFATQRAASGHLAVRYRDHRARARERSRNAQDYVAFVNTHQRRPDPASGDPVESALASWWVVLQRDAPDSREARLVADVLTITRL
ncbi:DUF3592 domain-containing protein [Cellulomonas sp. Leaf334]|uniref:DUF3592 domain-containing protein n=1 Tax=Cellulomonas sp. Leaf334 TaxID=1736339 RepID=UPI0007017592|nr:DUF3592 domain-containing protein [Cellulomonas sp. Leaf334]KQR17312.1 hypothetical protein ASF78_08480 [Cellulomonas sp. Leaf334]